MPTPHEELIAEIPRLRRFARAMARDAVRADDLVQDCLERAVSRLHLWRPGSSMRAWLLTMMRNLYINERRRRDPLAPSVAAPLPDLGAPAPQTARLVLRDLEEALAALSIEHREILLLVGVEGLTYQEAGSVLGLPIGTVMSRLARARERLRALLEGEPGTTLRRVK
jgi:RNA polymerase sigma-70 factor (ECF subfamily)